MENKIVHVEKQCKNEGLVHAKKAQNCPQSWSKASESKQM